MPLATGTVLGRFAILRPLGAGGLGEVYAALDGETGQEVALKVLHEHLAREPQLVERFKRELSVTRSLTHPGIVRAFDLHSTSGGRPFLSMELLRGETLAARLQRGPLARDEALRIARAVAEALQHAHAAGVVHRDLKPQNIFLPADGGLKLLDFGLARVAGWARLTAQSTVMGTPGYLAPEILAGRSADARADLYALGATLFEMLAGRRPFPGSDPYVVMRAQREGAAVPAELPDAALLRRALDPDPERRFLDAAQFLRALDGQVPDAPAPVLPLTAGDRDVVLHYGMLQRAEVRDVLRALSASMGWGRRWRLYLSGKTVLAQGVSRETADAIMQLCQERGLAVSVAQSRKPSRLARLIHRWAAPVRGWAVPVAWTAAFGGVWAWIVQWLGHDLLRFSVRQLGFPTREEVEQILRIVGIAGPVGALIAATLVAIALYFALSVAHGVTEPAPVRDLQPGDESLRRLVDGIGARLRSLREKYVARPDASKMLLDETLLSAQALEEQAHKLAEHAARLGDPLAGPDAPTLPPGMSAERDAAVSRLLSIASALDDALATRREKA